MTVAPKNNLVKLATGAVENFMNSPMVSVVIPCFNAGRTLEAAVRSALNQTYSGIELILVDDGSTDNTADVIRSLCLTDARVRAIFFKENRGPSVARNAAISISNAEWISLLDADDLYETYRLEELLKLGLSTGAELIADNIIVQDELSGRRKLGFLFLGAQPTVFNLSSFLAVHGKKKGELDLGFLKPLIQRRFLDDHKLEYAAKYRVGEDFLLYAECLKEGARLVVLPQAGYIYRRRADSITESGADNMTILAGMTQELMVRWRHQLSDGELSSLQTRQRLFDDAAKYQRFRAAISSGAILKAGREIVYSPWVIRELTQRVWRRVVEP
jgi:succinoglycan biosynthesis protein ExoO